MPELVEITVSVETWERLKDAAGPLLLVCCSNFTCAFEKFLEEAVAVRNQ